MIISNKTLHNRWAQAALLVVISVLLLCLPAIFGSPHDTPSAEKSLWLNFLGSFHPLFLHLPIGFILLIFTLEVVSFVKKDFKFSMEIPLLLNALAAVAAAVFGFIWYQTGEWKGETIDDHLWQGLIFASVAIWLPWIYTLVKEKTLLPYYLALFASIIVMTLAAHDGGKMSHGDPLAKAPWNLDEKKDRTTISDPIVYHDLVVPILEKKCYSCHGDNKQKGSLRLDSFAAILKGGEDGPALVKGDATGSSMIASIHAPEEEDFHMPPKEKPQITKDELAILEWWVSTGASEDKKLSELEATNDVLATLGKSSELIATESKAKNIQDALTSPLAKPMREFLENYPHSLAWTSKREGTLRFSAASMREKFGDANLTDLEPLASEIVELNLNSSAVTDAVTDFALSCPKLQIIKLGETKVTDAALEKLATHPTLSTIVLHSTAITDQGLAHLNEMQNLNQIYLWGTKVTQEAGKKFLAKHPHLTVDTGVPFTIDESPKLKSPYTGEMSLKLSSRYNAANRDKAFLDPNYTGNNDYNIHTNNDKGAWVEIDLKTEKELLGLNIFNRASLPERANRIAVEVSLNKASWETIYTSSGKVQNQWEVKTKAPIKARYIRIKINKATPEYLHLRNVQIFVK